MFDEIHYINDADRGKVWEECLIMLPQHVKLVLLSATIDKSEDFAEWVHKVRDRPIDLVPTFKRHVPLRFHYYFHGASKKGDTLLDEVSHRMVPLLDETGNFQVKNYENLIKVKRDYDKFVEKRGYGKLGMLNPLVSFLTQHNLCPALFFVFSRKKCETFAQAITRPLIDAQEQTQVEKIITQEMLKIEDRERFLNLPQFHSLKKMLMKGVSVHHSGLVPIFKEIVEILFGQKLVKVLFATETFAVGVNMPTKTVLYTDLKKRDNTSFRLLKTNEFTQMSGRAGRRGIDDVGHVIFLPNLFNEAPSLLEIRGMVQGKSQKIISKFVMDYQFVLKNLGETIGKSSRSLLAEELETQTNATRRELQDLLENPVEKSIFYTELREYHSIQDSLQDPIIRLPKKTTKQYQIRLKEIETGVPDFQKHYRDFTNRESTLQKIEKLQCEIEFNETYFQYYEDKIMELLESAEYISQAGLTKKGVIASEISECNPIILTEMLSRDTLDMLSGPELATVLSALIPSSGTKKDVSLDSVTGVSRTVKTLLKCRWLEDVIDHFRNGELDYELYLNSEWDLNYSIMETSLKWASGEDEIILPDGCFQGDFVKDMLKLAALCQTLSKCAELLHKTELVTKLKALDETIIRGVVTVNSLYIS